jgi:predicted permease
VKWLDGIALIFQRSRRDYELDEEIRTHLRMAIEDRVARGESPEEAARAARREFGDPDRVKEITRTMWRGAWLDQLWQDLRFGIRSLRRDPAFAWAAAVVLTIGIGANAAVFTLANGVLFRDVPGITKPDELVAVRWLEAGEQGSARESSWGYADYAYLRAETSAFQGVLGYLAQPIPVTMAQDTYSQADAWIVTDNFFDVLGVEMQIGRGFVREEGRTPGTHPVVVISGDLWRSRFGADPSVTGQTVHVNGTPFTIVGVTARDFRGISPIETPPDLYVPLMMQGAVIAGSDSWLERVDGERSGWLRLVARLRDGTTVAGAQANVDSVQAGWGEAFGGWLASLQLPEFRMVVTPEYKLNAEQSQRLRGMLGLLAVIVGAILVIGSANVAILVLAKGAERQAEIGVRIALGAGRGRLFAQLLTENVAVALLGGLGGVALAYAAVRAIVPLLPYQFSWGLAPDAMVLLFHAGLTLAVTLLFGVVPALSISRANPGSTLRRAARITRGNGLRNALVVGQIAVAVVLVAGAGLFVRSIVAAQSLDLGFEPDGRLIMVTDLSAHGYDDARGIVFMNEALSRARALPGVEQATVAARAPFRGRTTEGVRAPGTRFADAGTVVNFNWVGPSYFETIGTAIMGGRGIQARDDSGSSRVLVVNETTAAHLWPGEDAVGKTIAWRNERWTVVGVAADASYYALGEAQLSQVYVPMAQDFIPHLTFVLKAAAAPETLVRPMESVIRSLDPKLTIFGVQTLRDLVDAQSSGYRLLAVSGSAFAIVALVLAVAGLYGVQSYVVTQRCKEIGIRIAMGAQPWQVSASFLRRGTMLAGAGIGLGLPIAFALGRTVEGMLFGVQARDPVALIAVAAILLLTSMAASYLPARRAGRVAPLAVLREG